MLNRILGTEGNARQAVRLRRFMLAAATYAICVPLLFLAHAFGLVALAPVLGMVAAIAVINLALYLVFRAGLNQRFADPSLTWLQIFIGNTVVMYGAYSFNQGRSFVLSICLVVLMFGVFRFSTREFISITMQILAGYALVINLLMNFKPDTVNVYLEWFQWAGLAAILPLFAVVGGRISEMRQRLRSSNEELRSAVAAIRQMATHDNLTNLPNRALFNEELQHALARAERHRRPVALFFMDLDRFKNINDTLGHVFGDRVLQETARRLAGSVRDSDILARLGGDEFVLLVEEYGETGNLVDIAGKLLGAASQPVVLDGQEINLSVSIGICTYPGDGVDAKTLLANADVAMYRAKEEGRNRFRFYSAGLNANTMEKLSFETALRHAVERGELRVYYQPKIDIATHKLSGVEALLRWQHPQLGLLLPDKFIPLAEETGVIVPMGLWTLREVCTRARAWQDSGLPRISVAVNLSASQFHQERLAADLAGILKSTGIDPEVLELEITESMVMQDPDRAVTMMETLRRMGVRLAIDDFGTGYSSLGYLKRFPIDSLKVDKSFVRDLPHSSDDIAITRAVIAMAHSLQMNVIAEGVEHRAQFDVLREEGCDEFQGYLCRPPLPEEELLRFIRDEGARLTLG